MNTLINYTKIEPGSAIVYSMNPKDSTPPFRTSLSEEEIMKRYKALECNIRALSEEIKEFDNSNETISKPTNIDGYDVYFN